MSIVIFVVLHPFNALFFHNSESEKSIIPSIVRLFNKLATNIFGNRGKRPGLGTGGSGLGIGVSLNGHIL